MSGVDNAQVANEPIPLPDDGLQKSRIVGVIAKGCAYRSDDVIYVALAIDKQVGTQSFATMSSRVTRCSRRLTRKMSSSIGFFTIRT